MIVSGNKFLKQLNLSLLLRKLLYEIRVRSSDLVRDFCFFSYKISESICMLQQYSINEITAWIPTLVIPSHWEGFKNFVKFLSIWVYRYRIQNNTNINHRVFGPKIKTSKQNFHFNVLFFMKEEKVANWNLRTNSFILVFILIHFYLHLTEPNTEPDIYAPLKS